MIVLSCPEMRNDFNRLLIGLSTFDFIYLLMSTLIFTIPILSKSYAMSILPHIMPIGYGIAHLGRIGSVFMTLSVTLERFCAIVYPLKHYRLKTRLLIMGSTLFTILYNVPRFFEFKTIFKEKYGYIITASGLRKNYWYNLIYVVWMKFFLIEIVPYIVISALNALIIKR